VARLALHRSVYLSDDSVAALPYARGDRGVYIARDTELTGFRCVVNRNSKRLVYQGELREGGKRHTVYKRLGDPAHVKVSEARARALEELARLERLTDPDARAGTRFREAWESYRVRLEKKRRSDRTIADYRQKFDAHLAPTFGNVALRDITRADVVRLHDRLTADVGPYAANGVCRVGHAIYRHAALGMEVPDLSPTSICSPRTAIDARILVSQLGIAYFG
jgi:Phage integrase, N-terminal SAM-like domain